MAQRKSIARGDSVRRLITFFVSLGLHRSFLFLFSQAPPSFTEKTQPLITIDVVPKPEGFRSAQGSRKNKLIHRNLIWARSYKPRYLEEVPPGLLQTQQTKNSWTLGSSYDSDLLTVAEGVSTEEVRFLHELWREIDKAIVDSPYLAEFGHSGKVFLTFELDEAGILQEASFRASSRNSILKVFAARAIRQALKNENQEIRFLKKRLRINTRFSWFDTETCRSLKGIHQMNLSFCRYSKNDRKTFSAAEQVGALLGALRYGFGAAEEIQKYNREKRHRENQFDPFQNLRQDPDWNLPEAK